MLASLFAPEIYLTQFERLRTKARARHGRREPQSEGLSLSALDGQRQTLCRHLAHDIRDGRFEFSPLARVETFAQGKRRTIYRADLVDALVLGAMAQRLTALLEPWLGDSVYAYRPGRNAMYAIERLRAVLGDHRRARPDRKQRGLFVLQRDLKAFGESIPTHPASQLWSLLRAVLERAPDRQEAETLLGLLDRACRPEVRSPEGELTLLEHGLPTGSPIQQPLANLYLLPLDRVLGELECYARFGDDLLIVDSNLDRVQRAAQSLERCVGELELRFNPDKTRNLYFTAPGRPLGALTQLQFAPTSHLEYLGARVSFEGQLGLKRQRSRELLRRTRLRAENTFALSPPEQARQNVARAIAGALFDNSSLTDLASTALRTWVDDRTQLRQLDFSIAQLCAEVLSKRRGVRALRHTRPAHLRAAGLPSLLELRRRGAGRE